MGFSPLVAAGARWGSIVDEWGKRHEGLKEVAEPWLKRSEILLGNYSRLLKGQNRLPHARSGCAPLRLPRASPRSLTLLAPPSRAGLKRHLMKIKFGTY